MVIWWAVYRLALVSLGWFGFKWNCVFEEGSVVNASVVGLTWLGTLLLLGNPLTTKGDPVME